MPLLISIALKHLLARKRQSFVSMLGIVLGVAFFLAISGLMQGSETDFIRRLVDNTPHITIVDEYRNPRLQPVTQLYPHAAVQIDSVKPINEIRGIRGFDQILNSIRKHKGVVASPVLTGQAVVTYAGRDHGITLYGMLPNEIKDVSTINNYMINGSVDELISNPDGIIVGEELVRRLSLGMGDNLTVASPIGQLRTFKIVGIFRTGRSDFDERQTFLTLKRVQALLNRANRINNIIIKVPDPREALQMAKEIESSVGYKSISWQEASEDIMNTLMIRNIIMYTVVSAVLIVAAFGIFNVISTIVMEKHRDIAILKSMGFYARDIEKIFLFQGVILGILGNVVGIPFGSALMTILMQIRFKPPGGSEIIQMPISWHWPQFAIAAAFAMIAAVLAAFLPARKASRVQPVQILRGGQ